MLDPQIFSTYGYEEYKKLFIDLVDPARRNTFNQLLEAEYKRTYGKEHQFLNIGDVNRTHKLVVKPEFK